MAKGKNVNVSTKKVSATVAGKVAHAPAVSAPAAVAAPPSAVAPKRATVEEIALRAYAIYEAEGRPEGRHLDHWVRAERELGVG